MHFLEQLFASCFVPGDGIGGDEILLGIVSTKDECLMKVKANHPTANGATFSSGAGPGYCYAEFKMTGSIANYNWQTCLFEGENEIILTMQLFTSMIGFGL